MRKISLFLLFFGVLYFGCRPQHNSVPTLVPTAQGNAYYGGMFSWNEEEFFRTLYPPAIGDAIGHRIANQLYEGLVRPDQATLEILPALASSWRLSPDGKRYTFTIRQGVRFIDDPCFVNGKGRTVSAYDVKYCLDRACTFAPDNKAINFLGDRIVGAKTYFEQTKTQAATAAGVSGIQAPDSLTISIDLLKPFPNFLHILAMQYGFVYPHEAVEKYGTEGLRLHAVGTGAFYVKKVEESQLLLLLKNPHYWQTDTLGNQLPYLNGIRISFMGDKMSELLHFRQGKLSMMYKLPYEYTDEIVDRQGKLMPDYQAYVLQQMPSLSVQYYGFLTNSGVLANKKLRQAICYAVDKQRLADHTLKGAAVAATGRVPNCVPDYAYQRLNAYHYNPNLARQLLAEAGYPNAQGLPPISLQINGGAKRHEQIAEAIQKMLSETLNIKLSISVLPMAQHLENIEAGKAQFWRSGWAGDYPDPENFLSYFLSSHLPSTPDDRAYLNTVRYRNPHFDQLMAQALATTNRQQRNELYLQAEQLTLDDAIALNLFYEKDRRLLQRNVQNLPQNMLEYRNLSDVYLHP